MGQTTLKTGSREVGIYHQGMPRAVFFDLDDTILAWDAVADKSWRKSCRRFASRISGLQADKLFTTIKEVRVWYYGDVERHHQGRLNLNSARREVVSISFARLGIDAPELAKELADSYGVEREKAAFLWPGAINTLTCFRTYGCRLALITNGSSEVQRRKIERFGLAPFFDYILIEGEFGFGKPDERVFLHTLEQLDVTATEAWMIGDDLERDVAGAQRLGIFAIWVDWRGTGLPESTTVRPDRIIRTLSKLLGSLT